MEMHQLRYAVAVARTGNFSNAARQCNVAQPSLSQQIQKLEGELGQRLFVRKRRDVRLTPHGEAFLPRAVRILEEADAARREAEDAGSLLRGTISLGALPTIAPYLLPAAVAQFTAKHPGMEIVVHEDTTEQLLRRVLAYEIDFAVASQPIHDPRLEIRSLFFDELLLALPPGHRLARKRSVAPAELRDEPLIVLKEGHCLGDQVLGFCGRHDVRTRISFRSSQLETIQAFVRSGLGISLVPAMAVPNRSGASPRYLALQPPRPRREIVAVWPRQRPPGRGACELLKLIADRAPRRGRGKSGGV